MKKFEINLICNLSTRSDFYLLGLLKSNFFIKKVIILDNKKKISQKKKLNVEYKNFKILRKKNFKFIEYLKQKKINYEIIKCKTINNKKVYSLLKSMKKQKYFIVSLFPGDILKKKLFELKKNFIHAHAGFLPDYRGSTTNYYSYLDNKELGSSVIILNQFIDRGKIIYRFKTKFFKSLKKYDTCLDSFLRVYALCMAIKKILKNKSIESIKNNSKKGDDYYIIHPVLKNLSIMKK